MSSEGALIGVALTGSLSFVGTTGLVLLYILSPKRRTYGFRLVISLFVVDFIWSLNVSIPIISLLIDREYKLPMLWCKIQATIKMFTTLASFACTASIGWSLYTFLIRKKPIKTKNPARYFAPFTIILPIILSFLPLILDRYGFISPFDEVMCFLIVHDQNGEQDYLGIVLRLILYQLPFVSVFAFDIFTVIRVFTFIYGRKISAHEERDVKNMLMYPGVLFISWIFMMIQRVYELFSGHEIQWINNVDLAFATLNGFLNSLVYGYISLDVISVFKNKDSLNPTKMIFIDAPLAEQDHYSNKQWNSYQSNTQRGTYNLNPASSPTDSTPPDSLLTFNFDPINNSKSKY